MDANNLPNVFVNEQNELVILEEVYELTPGEKIKLARAKATCQETEKQYGTSLDDMFLSEISYVEMQNYIYARSLLVVYGYKPSDWRT